MFNNSSSPILKNCRFEGNTSHYRGGAMCNVSYSYTHGCNVKLENCTFDRNTANSGGGGVFWFNGEARVTNCTFSNNNVTASGACGGGMVAH